MQIRERLMACYKSMYQALFFSLSSQRSKEAKKKKKTTTTTTKQNKTIIQKCINTQKREDEKIKNKIHHGKETRPT